MSTMVEANAEVRRACQGDREALGRLLKKHEARLRQMVAAQIGGALRERAHTSDLLQSAYLLVVRGLEQFEGSTEEEFSSWVFRVLQNRIRERRRYFAAKKRDITQNPARLDERHLSTPSSEVCRFEDLQVLAESLDGLPEDYRRVILLRVADECSYAEIAGTMGRTEGSIRMLLARARAALALELERRERIG